MEIFRFFANLLCKEHRLFGLVSTLICSLEYYFLGGLFGSTAETACAA